MSNQKSKGSILFSSTGFSEQEWVSRIKALAPDREIYTQPHPSVEYAFLWKHPHGQLKDLPNLKVLFSLGAGVDHILSDKDIPDLPIVRAISDDLTARMSEFVIWQVLDHHRRGAFWRRLCRRLHQFRSAACRQGCVSGIRPSDDVARYLRHHGLGRG